MNGLRIRPLRVGLGLERDMWWRPAARHAHMGLVPPLPSSSHDHHDDQHQRRWRPRWWRGKLKVLQTLRGLAAAGAAAGPPNHDAGRAAARKGWPLDELLQSVVACQWLTVPSSKAVRPDIEIDRLCVSRTFVSISDLSGAYEVTAIGVADAQLLMQLLQPDSGPAGLSRLSWRWTDHRRAQRAVLLHCRKTDHRRRHRATAVELKLTRARRILD